MDNKTANQIASQALTCGYAVSTVVGLVGSESVVAMATPEADAILLVDEKEWSLLMVGLVDRQQNGKYQRATWYPAKGKVFFADSWSKIPTLSVTKRPTVQAVEAWVASMQR